MAKIKVLKSLFQHSWILWIVLSLICIQMNTAALAVSALLQPDWRTQLWHKISQSQQFGGKEMESMSNTELCLSLRSDRFADIHVWLDVVSWARTFCHFLFYSFSPGLDHVTQQAKYIIKRSYYLHIGRNMQGLNSQWLKVGKNPVFNKK